MKALKRSVRLMRSGPDGLRKCASDWLRMRARSSGLNLATAASTPTTPLALAKSTLARDVASVGPAWSNCAPQPSALPMELAMAAAPATTRFLGFLAPAEEDALLA